MLDFLDFLAQIYSLHDDGFPFLLQGLPILGNVARKRLMAGGNKNGAREDITLPATYLILDLAIIAPASPSYPYCSKLWYGILWACDILES